MTTRQSISDLLSTAVAKFGSRTAFARFSTGAVSARVSFEEVGLRVESMRRRLPPGGEPIAVVLDSGLEWAVAFLAIVCDGRAAVLVDAELAPALLVAQLEHAGACAALTSAVRLPALAKAWSAAGWRAKCEFLAIDQLVEANYRPESAPERIDATRPAAIVYTSGSTGTPKGVVLSHHAVVAAARRVAVGAQMKAPFVTLSLAPMAHAAGLHALLSLFVLGGQLLLLETKKPGAVFDAVRRGGVTHLLAPPVLYEVLVSKLLERIAALPRPARSVIRAAMAGFARASVGAPRLSAYLAARVLARARRELGPSLVTVFSAGAPLKARTAQVLMAIGMDIRDAYGLSETAGVICIAQQRFGLVPGRIGKPLPGTELKIVGAGDDGAGELWVRTDQVMLGYHRAPELTSEVIQDGWFRTGDMAQLDASGRVRICSRVKDIILTSNGKNVYPEDVEAHFVGVQGVGDVCALGIPSDDGGEVIGLAVISELRNSELSALRERLAVHNAKLVSQQRVQRFFIRSEPLPRTPLRKVQRNVLLVELLSSRAADSEAQRRHVS